MQQSLQIMSTNQTSHLRLQKQIITSAKQHKPVQPINQLTGNKQMVNFFEAQNSPATFNTYNIVNDSKVHVIDIMSAGPQHFNYQLHSQYELPPFQNLPK